MGGTQRKKGQSGKAKLYITRTRAVRKLQVSLRAFRKLCILKGVFPRDPGRKAPKGKNKTYYHVKDINYLMHDPVLQTLRQIKAYEKKCTKLLHRKEWDEYRRQRRSRPRLKLDHLVRERYPRFVDALRDLDDPLSMVHLFASLPGKIIKQHEVTYPLQCQRLAREWQYYVAHSHSVRKVFASIKGIYYQAEIQGQTITWLVPHQRSQLVPDDVDYRVMISFLEFYLVMVRFTLYKLFHDQGWKYPPVLDQALDEQGMGVAALSIQRVGEESAAGSAAAAAAAAAADSAVVPVKASKKLQKRVDSVVADIGSSSAAAAKEEDDDDDEDEQMAPADVSEDGPSLDDFSAIAEGDELTLPSQLHNMDVTRLFQGLTVVLSRETPITAMEILLVSGSARVLLKDSIPREQFLDTDDALAKSITHIIIDRPSVPEDELAVPGRVYVQPQWVFDSFNAQVLLPVEPYQPGVPPPPHLSPFVDDEAEGYIPKQREVLRNWGAVASGELDEDDADSRMADATGSVASKAAAVAGAYPGEDPIAAAERMYMQELQKERSGITFSEHQEAVEAQRAKDAEVARKRAARRAGLTGVAAEHYERKQRSKLKRKRAQLAASGRGHGVEDEEDDDGDVGSEQLAKIMMSKRDRRLYERIQRGKQKKAARGRKLMARRVALEEGGDDNGSMEDAAVKAKQASKQASKQKGKAKAKGKGKKQKKRKVE